MGKAHRLKPLPPVCFAHGKSAFLKQQALLPHIYRLPRRGYHRAVILDSHVRDPSLALANAIIALSARHVNLRLNSTMSVSKSTSLSLLLIILIFPLFLVKI